MLDEFEVHTGWSMKKMKNAGPDLAGGRPGTQLNCGSLDGRL